MFCQFLLRRKMNQLYVYTCVCAKSLQSCPILRFYGLQPARLLCSWDSPGKNTGVGCHVLQGLFLTRGLNPRRLCLLHYQAVFTPSATWEVIVYAIALKWASLVAQTVKRLPAVRETRVRSPGWEDPLEQKMATHSSILGWRIPWTEEPCRSQRVGHD